MEQEKPESLNALSRKQLKVNWLKFKIFDLFLWFEILSWYSYKKKIVEMEYESFVKHTQLNLHNVKSRFCSAEQANDDTDSS